MLLLSKNEQIADKWAKEKGLELGEYAFVDSPEILLGMESIPMVIFPEIKNRENIKEIFKMSKQEKVRPAFSTLFDPIKFNHEEPVFNALEPNFYNLFQIGLAIQDRAAKYISIIGNDIKIGKLNGIQGKSLGIAKPLFVKTVCGLIYIGKHNINNMKFPEETINY